MAGMHRSYGICLAAAAAGLFGCAEPDPSAGAFWTPPTPESMLDVSSITALAPPKRPAWDLLGVTTPRRRAHTGAGRAAAAMANWNWQPPGLEAQADAARKGAPGGLPGAAAPAERSWWDDVVADLEEIFGTGKDKPPGPKILPPETTPPPFP